MSLIKRAIKDRLIVIDPKRDTVTYVNSGKVRKWSNPEEKVQLESFLSLVYDYRYPPEQVIVSEKVKMGSASKEADVVVYKDHEAKDPYIVVECKKRKVSQKVFDEAIDQGFSYAAATNAEYVWATSGDKNAFFRVWDHAINERSKNRIRRLPSYLEKGKGAFSMKRFFQFWRNSPMLSDTFLFVVVLFLLTLLLSKLEITYHAEFYQLSKPIRNTFHLEFNWVYNLIVLTAALLSMAFGGIFMRSHQFFETPKVRKRTTYAIIALILFIPAWYMGVSLEVESWWTRHWTQAPWWTEQSYINMRPQVFFYLWPYSLSVPFQFLLIYGLIWIMEKTRRRSE